MQEIDMLKFRDELKRDSLYRLLKYDTKAKVALTAACVQLPALFLIPYDNIFPIFTILTITELRYILNSLKKYHRPENEQIGNILRNTTTYKECMTEYKNFVNDTALLIRNTGFKSAKDIAAYLQLLLDSGHFSKNMRHRYRIYNTEYEYVTELCGARVVTGTSVCRHMSSFFADVFASLGYTSACIQVNTANNNPLKVATDIKRIPNHAIVGVVDNNEKLMYDPTYKKYITTSDIKSDRAETLLIGEYVNNGEVPKYIIIDPQSKVLNPKREPQVRILNRTKRMTITQEESDYLKQKAEIIYRSNYRNQYEFYTKQEERKNRISELYSSLCPYSDSKIKKWTIKK